MFRLNIKKFRASFMVMAAMFFITAMAGCGGGKNSIAPVPVLNSQQLSQTDQPISANKGYGTVRLAFRKPNAGGSAQRQAATIPATTSSFYVVISGSGVDPVIERTVDISQATDTVELTLEVPAGTKRLIEVRALEGSNVLALGASLFDIEQSERKQVIVTLVLVPRVPDAIINSDFVLNMAVAPDSVDPSQIKVALAAIIESATGQPVIGLTAENFEIVEDGVVRFPITVTPITNATTSADIVFILDTTVSMQLSIDGVKNSIQEFVSDLAASNIDLNVGMVTFGDAVRNNFPMSSDINTFETFVGNQIASGGVDNPENPLDAIAVAANTFTYRPEAVKIMILITDDEMHQHGDSTASADPGASFINSTADIITLVKHKFVVHVVDIDWGEGDRNPRVLATNTGGAAYDLPNDGSVNLMELPIKDMLKSGYALTFTTGRLGTTHSIRLVVKTEAAKQAEMTYSAFY